MKKQSKKRNTVLIYIALAAVTFIAFEQVRQNDFIDYDDDTYITSNPHVQQGITPKSIRWAFTTGYQANWHPLTWLSHMLDCKLFGPKPAGHHMTNLFFHIINTLLLFAILKAITKATWPSVFVAALFAIHPLHVESVAWAAERKDVLSTIFWMLTIAAYIRYANKPAIARYLLVALAFALGLMAKPMIVTLPFVLLLLDYWPLNRFRPLQKTDTNYSAARLIAEKIPLFAIAAASSVITFIVQQKEGAVAHTEMFPLSERIANAAVSYISYLTKMLYPNRLGLLYPLSPETLAPYKPILAALILIAITAAIIYFARKKRYLATGWLWYLGTLVPVIGIVQVGTQSMADRYTYIPLIGIFMIIAWSAAEFTQKFKKTKPLLAIPAVIIILVLTLCTRAQVKVWNSSISLFEHTIKVTDGNFILHNNLAKAFLARGDIDQAILNCNKAIEIKPDYAEPHCNLAKSLYMQGDLEKAIQLCQLAIELNPDLAVAHYNLANGYREQGKFELAVTHYTKAVELIPDYFEALSNLGLLLRQLGRYDQALIHQQTVINLRPDHIAYFNLGSTFFSKGDLPQAITNLKQSLQLNPNWPNAHYMIGNVYYVQTQYELAITHWKEAVTLSPKSFTVLKNLTMILATCKNSSLRNPAQAVKYGKQACELTGYRHPEILDALAAAYNAAGDTNQAIKTAERAINLANTANQNELAKKIQTRLNSYKNK